MLILVFVIVHFGINFAATFIKTYGGLYKFLESDKMAGIYRTLNTGADLALTAC